MRHPLERHGDGPAADVLAQHERQSALGVLVGRRLQQLAQIDRLAPHVRQFDADHVATGHDGDAHRHGAHVAGDVVGEADDARRLGARCRLQLIERDHRPRPDLHDLAAHAEIVQDRFQQARILLQRRIVDLQRLARIGRHRQQLARRQAVAVAEGQVRLAGLRPHRRALLFRRARLDDARSLGGAHRHLGRRLGRHGGAAEAGLAGRHVVGIVAGGVAAPGKLRCRRAPRIPGAAQEHDAADGTGDDEAEPTEAGPRQHRDLAEAEAQHEGDDDAARDARHQAHLFVGERQSDELR